MKVPHLSKKRQSELRMLASQFATATSANLALHTGGDSAPPQSVISLYPLFALLQSLNKTDPIANPSREHALSEAQLAGSRALFVSALRSFSASADVYAAMQRNYSDSIFSGFIRELRSDLLMFSLHSMIFSYRAAAISLRCALEDLYRHIYYKDHPQEFRALVSGRRGEFSADRSPRALRQYLVHVSELQPFSTVDTSFREITAEGVQNLFGTNEGLYSDLSEAVHGATDRWFAAHTSAQSLTKSADKDKSLASLSTSYVRLSIAFLIACHKGRFASMGEYDKSIVLDCFEQSERGKFRQLLNV